MTSLRRKIEILVFSLAVAVIVGLVIGVVANNAIFLGVSMWVQCPLIIWSGYQSRAIAVSRSLGWKWHPVLKVSEKRLALARRTMWVALSVLPVPPLLILLLDRNTNESLSALYISVLIMPLSLYQLFHWAFRPENFLTDKALFWIFHPAAPVSLLRSIGGVQEALPDEWLASAMPYFRLTAEDKLAERTLDEGRSVGNHCGYAELHAALFDRLKTGECLGYYTMEPALRTALSRFVRAIRQVNNDAARQPSLLEDAVLRQSQQWREVRAAATEVIKTRFAEPY